MDTEVVRQSMFLALAYAAAAVWVALLLSNPRLRVLLPGGRLLRPGSETALGRLARRA